MSRSPWTSALTCDEVCPLSRGTGHPLRHAGRPSRSCSGSLGRRLRLSGLDSIMHDPIGNRLYWWGMDQSAGSLIRDARLHARLSQSELARRAGIAQPVVSAYETGSREPGLAMLQKLLLAAGHQLEVSASPLPDMAKGLPDSRMGRRLRRRRRTVLDVCERRGAKNVRLFGSVARGEDTDSSDVDLLVDLDEHVGLIALVGLERELRDLLGVEVDVVPANALKSGAREQITNDAIPL